MTNLRSNLKYITAAAFVSVVALSVSAQPRRASLLVDTLATSPPANGERSPIQSQLDDAAAAGIAPTIAGQ